VAKKKIIHSKGDQPMTIVNFGVDRLVTIVSDKPVIPDGNGKINMESMMNTLTGFKDTHTVLYDGVRTATLIPKI
jgi:hypothetical protein